MLGASVGTERQVVCRKHEADVSSNFVSDLGSEWNASDVCSLVKHCTVGANYAPNTAGGINVDTNKVWLWASLPF